MEQVPTILLVDDSPGDSLLFETAFDECGLRPLFHVCASGHEALTFLHRNRLGSSAPDLIMVDDYLSTQDSLQLVAAIKKNPATKHIPTIILAVTFYEANAEAFAKLGADAYLVKPGRWNELAAMVKLIARNFLAVKVS